MELRVENQLCDSEIFRESENIARRTFSQMGEINLWLERRVKTNSFIKLIKSLFNFNKGIYIKRF